MRALSLEPGSVVLPPESVACLVEHLRRSPQPSSLAARALVADLVQLSQRPVSSRDVLVLENQQLVNSKLTTEQAARCLGITPGAVRRRINRGCLPASFEDGRWLIDAKEL